MGLNTAGYATLPATPASRAWAAAALSSLTDVPMGPTTRRHGGTWFVGVDALANDPTGGVGGVPLCRTAIEASGWNGTWHNAQVSGIYPGYPGRDPDETEAAHGYRLRRDAAHVDGLLPEGAARRRFLREPHAVILGIALTDATIAPTVVWEGSQEIVRRYLLSVVAGKDPTQTDLTEAYHAARREAFEHCPRRRLTAEPGQMHVIHRLAVHGTEAWGDAPRQSPRIVAFFRPQLASAQDWLELP